MLVPAESSVTAQFSWELPVGRREDFRRGRAQDWGRGKDQGKLLGGLGLGANLEEGKHLFGESKGEVDI